MSAERDRLVGALERDSATLGGDVTDLENEIHYAARAYLAAEDAAVADLLGALKEALEGMEDMRAYVPDYFATKWGHDDAIARARDAIARAEGMG